MSQVPVPSSTMTHTRRHPRLRVAAPFPCSFALVGLKKWVTATRGGIGVVYDLSTNGARVMTEVDMTPGDHIAVSLRLPRQVPATFVDATVRWGKEQTYGLEFSDLSPVADMRLRKFLARLSAPPTENSHS